MKKNWQLYLFFFSIFVHLFYYISAFYTQTLAIFYVTITKGQDFFQIPNGVYAFFHSGTLNGYLPAGVHPYVQCCSVNFNVYHPLFTLLVGTPLIFFRPWTAFGIWAGVHLLTTVFLVYFLWSKFKHHKYIYLALSLFLLNSYHYYEIWHAQYQFLVNFFTVLFLYESIKKGDTKKAGIYLFLSLLVKPIGLLWVLPLLIYKRFKTVSIGFGLFLVATGIFYLFPFGRYYVNNLIAVSSTTIATHNIYAIRYIVHSFPLQDIKAISYIIAFAFIIFQVVKKPGLYIVITLWIGYQLIFYNMVYHYQYTILAGVFCLGILFDIISPKKLIMIPILFLTLPSTVVLFHLHGEKVILRPHNSWNWLYMVFWLSVFLGFMVNYILSSYPNKVYLTRRERAKKEKRQGGASP